MKLKDSTSKPIDNVKTLKQRAKKILKSTKKVTSSSKKTKLEKQIERVRYGGKDCMEVMGLVNNKANVKHKLSKGDIESLCNKIVEINNREKRSG
jgi:hypothetical protein